MGCVGFHVVSSLSRENISHNLDGVGIYASPINQSSLISLYWARSCPRSHHNVNYRASFHVSSMSVKELFTRGGNQTNIVDRILSSPSLFLIALGTLMIVVALILQKGTWPAIMVIFGGSLVIAGGIAQLARMWSRRKS